MEVIIFLKIIGQSFGSSLGEQNSDWLEHAGRRESWEDGCGERVEYIWASNENNSRWRLLWPELFIGKDLSEGSIGKVYG